MEFRFLDMNMDLYFVGLCMGEMVGTHPVLYSSNIRPRLQLVK